MVRVNKGFSVLRSYIFENLRQKALSKGDNLISLVSGNPDLPTPKAISDTLAREAKKYHPGPSVEGIPELREAISSFYYSRFGVSIPPSNIVVGYGIKSDMSDVARVFSNVGDSYVIFEPSFPVIMSSAGFEGREHLLSSYQLGQDPNFFLRDNYGDDVAIVYFSNPNNPTGEVLNLEGLTKIIKAAKPANALVLSDIIYTNFNLLDEETKSPSILQVDDAKELSVELGGFKFYSMTGYRVSWFATFNEEILDYWKKFKSNRDKGTPISIQKAAHTALTDENVVIQLEAYMDIYRERAQLIKDGLESMGLEVHGLHHTPFAWIKVPEGYSSEQFVDKVLNEANVLLVPGNAFGSAGEGYVRASIFQKKEIIEKALTNIGKAV